MSNENENPVATLTYPLHNGFIHDWLVVGPLARNTPDGDLVKTPAEGAPLLTNDNSVTLPNWRIVHCRGDHFVDLSAHHVTLQTVTAWTYAEIATPTDTNIQVRLTTQGQFDLWCNGELVQRSHTVRQDALVHSEFSLTLQSGRNSILLRLAQSGVGDTPLVLAFQCKNLAAGQVVLPTTLPLIERRRKLEQIFTAAYVEQTFYQREEQIQIKWPSDLPVSSEITVRLQSPNGRIYAETHPQARGGAVANLGKAYQFPEGSYQVVLMPTLPEYYEHGLRIRHSIDVAIATNQYSTESYGTYAERQNEALTDAAKRSDDLYAEIAKIALGRWPQVKTSVIENAIQRIEQATALPDQPPHWELIGLLGLYYRYRTNPAMPAALRARLEVCLSQGRVGIDEKSNEGEQILTLACQVLLQPLTNSTASRSEAETCAWLHQRARNGFAAWHSQSAFEQMIVALSHLADLAANVTVAELAAVLLDKILTTLALNSFQGRLGGPQARTTTAALKCGWLEPTAGICRLLWGEGVFNQHSAGVVSLACALGYTLPPIIAEIATAKGESLWSREHQQGQPTDANTAVDLVTYKTPDYLLTSAQDYHPGQRGSTQQLWQANFGPAATIFVNHPTNQSEQEVRQPNFWRGNGVLPRIAQWQDALIALHHLPDDDWLGYTHAYLPVHAFDEYLLRDGWAFVRKNSGYAALTAAAGLELITTVPSAFCELRSVGLRNIWFLQLGRAAQDGSFADFQTKILALDVTFADLAIHTTTLRGESLDFGWEGPLLVNEQEQPLHNFPHIDHPFCQADNAADQLEIRFGDQLLRLNFAVDQT